MLNEIIRTGSVSQDALRLGFQTTCEKGIAKLLNVDDITVEECSSFLERHQDKVERYLNRIKEVEESIANDKARDFNKFDSYDRDRMPIWTFPILRFRRLFQEDRRFTCSLKSVSGPELDIRNGRWESIAIFVVTKHAWKGVKYRGMQECTEETFEVCKYIRTDAKKCVVNYTDYDNYSNMFVPDDAAEAAKDAVDIGMTNLMVAVPKMQDGGVKKDPIIIGHVGNQKFIIAWFGYGKSHFSCNT